jgi:RNA recognition motif-containing protein
MKILVRKLSRSTTEHAIRALFAEHGFVQECTLVLDQVSGLSKGFAFVEMPNEKEAEKAVNLLNEIELDKKKIRVKNADNN